MPQIHGLHIRVAVDLADDGLAQRGDGVGVFRIARIAKATDRGIPAAGGPVRAEPRRHIARKLLHPLMRRVAVRVEVDVGQPFPPQPAADQRFGQQRVRDVDLRGYVHAKRAVASGVQHVRGRQLLQVVRHLRAVRIFDRVQDDIHLLQQAAVRRVRDDQFGQLQDVAGRRHLVGVLPAGDEHRGLERGELGERNNFARRRLGQLQHRDIAAAIGAARLIGADLGERRQLRDQGLRLVGTDHVVPRHQRQRRPRARRQCARRRRGARVGDGAAGRRVFQRDVHRDAIDVVERQRRPEEPGAVQPRERVQRIGGARRLLVVLGLDLQLDLADAVRPHDRPQRDRRGGVDLAEVAVHPLRRARPLFAVADLDRRLRRGVAGVEHLDLAWLAAALGVDDRKDFARASQPLLGGGAAQSIEEVQRHEIQVFVQGLERRDELFIHADAEVRLAHPHVDVEIAEEGLLVRHRFVVGDLHHVVVDARQYLRLVVVPEALGVGLDAAVGDLRAVDGGRQPARCHLHLRPAGKLVEVLARHELRAEGCRVHDAAGAIEALDGVDVGRRIDQFKGELLAVDAQLALHDLVDRIQLVEPTARHHVELLILGKVGLVLGHLHAHGARALALERRDHFLRDPHEALLVG